MELFVGISGSLTRSKAVEHARGCVATKIGLPDIIVCRTMFNIDRNNCNLQVLSWGKSPKVIVNRLAVDQASDQSTQG